MKLQKALLAATLLAFSCSVAYSQNYVPAQENIENRKAFENERFGIFLHWGIYSAFAQGEWYLNTGKLNKDEYAKAASAFYPANYNAAEWVKAFKESGARYVTMTSRHHDGFSMYDTKTSDYDIVEATPWGKDVIKELADACHDQGLALHFYYSILDWIREDYPVGRTGHDSGRIGGQENFNSYFNFMKAQVKELLEQYKPVRAIWLDGYWDQDQKPDFDWRMPEFYEYVHSLQPSCLMGNNHHIATIDGEDFQMFEKDLPGRNTAGFSAESVVSETLPLEMCQTMNNSWGYRINDQNYKSTEELVRTLATAVSLNSNLLLNIGPQSNGELPAAALERLKEIGAWLKVNGEAIYGCGPGPVAEQEWGVTTAPMEESKTFYLHLFKSPGAVLEIPVAKRAKAKSVTALDGNVELVFKKVGEKLFITLPSDLPELDYVVAVTMK